MAKNGNCEHEGIMEMVVMETRKCGQIVVRIRRCDTCGSRVRTGEMMEEKRMEERRFAEAEVKRLTDELRVNVQMIKRAKEAIEVLAKFLGVWRYE